MSKVSFEEIGGVAATFLAEEGVEAGQVVKVTGNGQVGPCADGDAFCGVALDCRDGCAGVQVKGFLTLKATGAVTLGLTPLCADGAGGVKETSTGGVTALVVSADTDQGTCVVCL